MSNHCKIEFYFKKDQLLDLINENPDAKGIIIRQEIKPRKNADGKGFTNVVVISAHAKHSKSRSAMFKTELAKERVVLGCPNPPGCDADDPEL